MSSIKYNSNCNLSARSCVSGCCTYSGSCALTSSNCYYQYSDYYSNYNYYYPGSYSYPTTIPTKSLGAEYYVKMLAMPLGITLGYLLLVIIGVIICYCRRKPTVEAINRMATHNWWDGSPIIRGNGNDATQPAYAVSPTYPQTNNVNPQSSNIPTSARYYSPQKDHVLQINDTDLNVSMEKLVLRSRQVLPSVQRSPNTSNIVNRNQSIIPIGQFEQNLPEISLKTANNQGTLTKQFESQPFRQSSKVNIQFQEKKILDQPGLKPGQSLVEHTIRYIIDQYPGQGNKRQQQKVENVRKMEEKEQEFAELSGQPKIEHMGNQNQMPIQESAQKLMQQPLQQNAQQPNQKPFNSFINQQQPQKQTYPMPPSKFDNISNSLNTIFNSFFQNNAQPVKLVSYQPPIDSQ